MKLNLRQIKDLQTICHYAFAVLRTEYGSPKDQGWHKAFAKRTHGYIKLLGDEIQRLENSGKTKT